MKNRAYFSSDKIREGNYEHSTKGEEDERGERA